MIIAANPPIDLPLENLNADQKWKVFQFLWKDVVDGHEAEIEPPAWHEEVLQERMEKIESGKAVWHDLDQAFDDLRKEACGQLATITRHGVRITQRTNTLSLPIKFVGVRNS